MTVRAKALGRRQLRLFPDFHQGAVRALCLPSFASNIVLSAGDDGRVKILDISTGFTLVGLYGKLKG
jgi:WD40 repeat protein